MIHNVYAVYDHAAKAFLPPFCLRNDGQAIRAFTDCANSANHQFNEHPGDYNLFHIATMCDSLGEFTNVTPSPRNLGSALSVLRLPSTPNQMQLIDTPSTLNGSAPKDTSANV